MDWRSTITKLLNKAENPATPQGERDALNERAAYLMAKYGITEKLQAQTAVEPPAVKVEEFTVTYPYKTHKQQLLNGLTIALGGQAVVSGKKMYVFGSANDVDRIAVLYTSLLLQGLLGVSAATVPAHEHGKTYKHSWLLNFVWKVVERVQIAAARAKAETPGTDVVLARSASVVNRAVKDYFPHTKDRGYEYGRDSAGHADGQNAGNMADIGQPRMGGSVRSLPSGA